MTTPDRIHEGAIDSITLHLGEVLEGQLAMEGLEHLGFTLVIFDHNKPRRLASVSTCDGLPDIEASLAVALEKVRKKQAETPAKTGGAP